MMTVSRKSTLIVIGMVLLLWGCGTGPRLMMPENGVTLHFALPGVAREDLKLTLHESKLRIEARRSDAIPESWKTHRDSGVSKRYGLDLRLTPRFDGTKASATLEGGVLTLQVPVREEAKPREIPVS